MQTLHEKANKAAGELENRAEVLGLSLTRLAILAGVAPSTALRRARGATDNRMSTEAKLRNALVRHELQVLRHLIAIHGIPETLNTERAA